MEDRQPTGLLLAMVDGEDSAAMRARDLADSLPRVTVFANCNRDRTDLPRTIDDSDFLLVGETDDVAALSPLIDERTFAFRRYPRPSQGVLGTRTTGLQVVLISPKRAEQAQSLRDWGDHVHLRHIAAARVPGFTTITSYENAAAESPRYLHLYEMDADDPEAAFRTMTPCVVEHLGGGPGTPAYDEWAWHPALWINYVNTFAAT